ncbi:hypothetical protein GGF32_006712 [Allomyces javanicus]|nr:hypothetical protein GGF32_006712 [Allomyces javanicus]
MRLLVSVHPPDAPVGAAATAPLRFVFAVPAHAVHIGDLAHAILDRAGFDQEAAVAALSLDGFNLVPEDAVATVLTNNDKVDVHVTHIIPPPPSARKKRARAPSPDAFNDEETPLASTRSRKRARTALAPAAALPARTARARSAVAGALLADSDALDAITHHLVTLIARQSVGAAGADNDDEDEEDEDEVQYDGGADEEEEDEEEEDEEEEDEEDDDDYEDAAEEEEEDDDQEVSDEAPDELPARASAKTAAASRAAPIVQDEEDDDDDEDDDKDYEAEEEAADDSDANEEAAVDNVEPLVTDSDDEAITSAYDQLLKDLQPAPAVSANGKKNQVTKADKNDDDDEEDSDFEMASDADDSPSSGSDIEDDAVSDSDSSSSSSDDDEDGEIAHPAVPALTFEAMDDSDSDHDSDAAFDAPMSSLAVTAVDCTKFPATKCAPTDARQALATAAKKNKKTRRGTRGGAGKSRKDTAVAAADIDFAKCAKLTPMMARKVPAGTQLAFRQMHLSEDCTPEVSEYRVAKVLDQQGVEFTVQWAAPIVEAAAKATSRGTPHADDGQWVLNYDEENGGDTRPRGLAKFVFEDGHADGNGEKATITFAEMVQPVIVSWGSRPATPARGGATTATPASATKAATPKQAATPSQSSK